MNRRGDSISNAALTMPLLPFKRKKRLTRPVLRHSAFFFQRRAFFLSQKERFPGKKDFFPEKHDVFIGKKECSFAQRELCMQLKEVPLGSSEVVLAKGSAGLAMSDGCFARTPRESAYAALRHSAVGMQLLCAG